MSNRLYIHQRVLFLIALLCLGSSWASPDIQSWQTSNGARVLFVAAPELPMLDVRVVFDAGSARDGEMHGISRLTNALLSEGAGQWSADQLAERLDSVGTRLGSGSLRDMAWLSIRTLTKPKDTLNTSIETLAAMLATPRFDAKDLERIRKAMLVGLEQEQQLPGKVARKQYFQKLYSDHPYANHSSGEPDSLNAIGKEDLIAHHQRLYVGANAVVAMVGAIDRAEAEAIAQRVVNMLPKGMRPQPLPKVAKLKQAHEIRIDFPSSQSHLLMGQPGIQRKDPDYFALYVGNHILGGSGLVSQLSDEVREKRGLSYSAYSYFSPMREKGPFMMGAQTKNSRVDETQQVMRQTLERFIEQGPSRKELKEAKKNITGSFPLDIASNKKIVSYLSMIGFYDLPDDYLDTFTKRVNQITQEQIKEAFGRRIHPERMLTVVVGR